MTTPRLPSPLLPPTLDWPVWKRQALRQLEREQQALSPEPLMVLAGQALARLARALAPHARCVWVLAGPGNNGGDGIEAATILHRAGQTVLVSLLGREAELPADAAAALARARQAGVNVDHGLPDWPLPLGTQDLCIDALLGLGASREPEGELVRAIEAIAACPAPVLAVDLPSGLDADSGQILGSGAHAVRADHTLTLLGAKPGLFMGHGRDLCGQLWLDTLGPEPGSLPALAQRIAPQARLLSAPPAATQRHASHKGSHGDVAVVGGQGLGHAQTSTTAMVGAAVLAAQAALSAGAGRVWLALLGQNHAGIALPADLMQAQAEHLPLSSLTVVAGCGGGTSIVGVLPRLIQHSRQLVLDADGLNALAADPWLQDLMRQRAQRQQVTVISPHPLEAARLLGVRSEQVQADRLDAAECLAQTLQCTVVLKGSGTVIAHPGHTPWINTTGNARLAIAGTGDVLAGMLGAALARRQSPLEAVCWAVHRHGLAAQQWPTDRPLSASALAAHLPT